MVIVGFGTTVTITLAEVERFPRFASNVYSTVWKGLTSALDVPVTSRFVPLGARSRRAVAPATSQLNVVLEPPEIVEGLAVKLLIVSESTTLTVTLAEALPPAGFVAVSV